MMTLETILAALLALFLSFIICGFFWPREKSPYREDYIAVLDSKIWKRGDIIYQEILKRSTEAITENEHEHILIELMTDGIVEARPLPLKDVYEVESSNDSGRSHIDRTDEYILSTTYEYRLISDDDSGSPINTFRHFSPRHNLVPIPLTRKTSA